MPNTFNKQNKITLDTSELKRLEFWMKRYAEGMRSKEAEKVLDKELRKAVKPWQEAVNGGWMYKYVKENQGRLQDPFGNTKIKGKRRYVFGRRVGPKMRGKSGGWFAHFFATPAKQLKGKYKIPFFSQFKSKNGEVAALAKLHISKAVSMLSKKYFR